VLCDTIAIMDEGKIIVQGSPRHLVDIHCAAMPPESRNLESVFLTLTGKRLRE
jgi:ABC-2 type transport system ATP-binding protein